MFASFVSVPETSIYEDYSFVFRQNDIRFAWKFADIDSIAISSAKQFFSYKNFRFGILGTNLSHTMMALFIGQCV